jgi:elongation factor G
VVCGVATRNLGTNRLLDAIVEDLPSTVKHGALELPEVTLEPDPDRELFAYVFKTKADPFAGRINFFRVYQGTMKPDTQVLNTRAHTKERVGQLLSFEGRETKASNGFGPGDIGAVAKLKETRAGDWLAARDEPIEMPAVKLPQPVMAFAIEPKTKGDEDKVFSSLRPVAGGGPDDRPAPRPPDRRSDRRGPLADPRRGRRRPPQVALRGRGHAQAAACALPGDDPPARQGARAPQEADRRPRQFGDCHIEIEPLPDGSGFEFVNAIKGGVIPTSFIPAVQKGCLEAMAHGAVAGYPVKGVRVKLFDGSFHTVDSSEMAFKMAGSIAMRQALEQAGPVLLEPIMLVTLSVPDDTVGDVIGDLNSRRGRPQGMEPSAGMTEVKAEVPMAEMLTVRPGPAAITGGQGDYTMEFLRYEEVPGHLAQRVVEQAKASEDAVRV